MSVPQRDQAAPDAPVREVKLVGPAACAAQIAAVLAARCRRDPDHPGGRVTSIYYDTRDLRLLDRKRDSDFLKSKVRLRWYGGLDGEPDGGAFLEIKRKVGGIRYKRRIEVPIAARTAAALDLESARLGRLLTSLPADVRLPSGLQPLLSIAFDRRRFRHPESGARVALDLGIRVARVHRGRLPCVVPPPLSVAVVEIKGAAPRSSLYRILRALGLRRRAFSKYAVCLDRVIGTTRLG